MRVLDSGQELIFSIVYASYKHQERKTLYEDLVRYTQDHPILVDSHLLLARDFNYIHRVIECLRVWVHRACLMKTFNDFIFHMALMK